nr:unnamed protein product [Callosobruchus chinensis]
MKSMLRHVLGIAGQPDATDVQPPPPKKLRCAHDPRIGSLMMCSKCRKPIRKLIFITGGLMKTEETIIDRFGRVKISV